MEGALELLGDLLTWPGPRKRSLRGLCLTDADIFRVRDFVKFWRPVDSKPVWFVRVLEDLADGLDDHDDQG